MKIISIVAFLFAISFTVKAQHTYPGIPLYGTAANQDRTYRSLQIGTASIVNTTVGSIDTITLIPGFVSGAGAVFHKNYFLTVSDTAVLAIKDVSSSYTGSTMSLFITSPNTNSLVKFLGYSGFATQWALDSAGTSYLPTQSHYLIMNFVCTGSKWALTSKSQD